MAGTRAERGKAAGPGDDRALRQRLRRGMLELDLILERFYRDVYPVLDEDARQGFVRLLDGEDDLLWEWLTGRGDPREPDLVDAVRRIRQHAGL